MNKNNKGVLILIIIMLAVSSFFTIISGNAKKELEAKEKSKVSENANRELKYDGKLYFYSGLNLVGTYTCNDSNCDYITSTIDDSDYSLNYYKAEGDNKITLIARRYAFITDGNDEIMLYDVINSNVVNKFNAVKNYGIGIQDNYFIVQDSNKKWGIIKIDNDGVSPIIDYKYDFIGVHNLLNEESKLENTYFVVKDTNGWKIINNTNMDQSTYFINAIFDYNDKYVITKTGTFYYLSSLNGNMLTSSSFNGAKLIGKYIAVVDSNNQFYIFDPSSSLEVSKKYFVNDINDIELNETESGITISINGEIQETIR